MYLEQDLAHWTKINERTLLGTRRLAVFTTDHLFMASGSTSLRLKERE